MSDWHRLDASTAAARVRRGELTFEALVAACLERSDARERDVGAWPFLAREQALMRAREADRSAAQGPLHGVPIAVKDLINTFDMPTAQGSPNYADRRPSWDAACVAAADADFMVPLGFGTQTAASVTRPAAFCGVVGYKGAFGELSLSGVRPLARDALDRGLARRTPACRACARTIARCASSLRRSRHAGNPRRSSTDRGRDRRPGDEPDVDSAWRSHPRASGAARRRHAAGRGPARRRLARRCHAPQGRRLGDARVRGDLSAVLSTEWVIDPVPL